MSTTRTCARREVFVDKKERAAQEFNPEPHVTGRRNKRVEAERGQAAVLKAGFHILAILMVKILNWRSFDRDNDFIGAHHLEL